MHTILEAILALGDISSSTPLYIIGSIIDRGWSLNDYDVVALDNSLILSKLEDNPPPGSHIVPLSWLRGKPLPPLVQLGSKTLWDFVEAGDGTSTAEGCISLAETVRLLEEEVRFGNESPKILSVGFGNGQELQILATLGEVVGIEVSPSLVQKARDRGFEAYLMDMNLLDFEDNLFDIYFSHHALEHSVAPCLALSEAFRVLRPGGKLCLVAPVGYDHPAHRYNFTPHMLENMVKTAGFSASTPALQRAGFFDQLVMLAKKQGA